MSDLASTAPTASTFKAWAPYLALLGAITSICFGASLAKQLFPMIGAEATSAYRLGFSAFLLAIVFRPWRLRLAGPDVLRLAIYGGVLGLMNLTFYMALRTIPLGLAIAIEFIGPLSLSLVLARRPAHFAAIALAIAGLALLLPVRGAVAGGLDPAGVGFALAAGAFWALYIICGKRTGHLPGGPTVALGMAFAALFVVPIGVHAGGAAMLSPAVIVLGLGVAILSSAIPYSLEMVALRRVPTRNLGVLLSIEPAAGALAGMLLLGEMLRPGQWLAIGLVVAASALSVGAGREQAA